MTEYFHAGRSPLLTLNVTVNELPHLICICKFVNSGNLALSQQPGNYQHADFAAITIYQHNGFVGVIRSQQDDGFAEVTRYRYAGRLHGRFFLAGEVSIGVHPFFALYFSCTTSSDLIVCVCVSVRLRVCCTALT